MNHLAELREEARKLALDRFHLLQPYLENDRPLKAVAAAGGIPFRTAQRWMSLCRQFGLATHSSWCSRDHHLSRTRRNNFVRPQTRSDTNSKGSCAGEHLD